MSLSLMFEYLGTAEIVNLHRHIRITDNNQFIGLAHFPVHEYLNEELVLTVILVLVSVHPYKLSLFFFM